MREEDYPYVLCPDLKAIDVKVAPLWFKPKGGGRQCPVVMLEGVPVGYQTVLEVSGFIKRQGGWLVDATDKTESFWRRIFGPIECVQKKPVRVFEPRKIVFAPPPPSVKAVVHRYTNEHIHYLTKKDQVIGHDALTACKADAERGAVCCRGVWAVLKAACLDRLKKNPEDVGVFEYAWSTAQTYSLDTAFLPETIDHNALLRKIIERGRVTAQMEAVVAASFRRPGPVLVLAHADWRRRRLVSGSSMGGPLDVADYDDVDRMAQALLDRSFEPDDDPDRCAAFYQRIVDEIDDAGGWVETLDIPQVGNTQDFSDDARDGYNSFPDSESDQVNQRGLHPVGASLDDIDPAQSSANDSTSLSWPEVFRRITSLMQEVKQRTDYARIISTFLLESVIDQPAISLHDQSVVDRLESLIGYFDAIVDRDGLYSLWRRHAREIRTTAQGLCVSPKTRLQVMRVLIDATHVDRHIESKLMENNGLDAGWWWRGYSASRTPLEKGSQWEVYRINGEVTEPTDLGVFATRSHASEALCRRVRARRIKVIRSSFSPKRWCHVYSTSSGPLLRLSEDYSDHSEAIEQLPVHMPQYLSEYRLVGLWYRNHWGAEEVLGGLRMIAEALELGGNVKDFAGRLRVEDGPDGPRAYWDEARLEDPLPGTVALLWARGLVCLAGERKPGLLESITEVLLGGYEHSDLDIAIEDDLLDQIDDDSDQLAGYLGAATVDCLTQAVEQSSPETESAMERLYSEAVSTDGVPDSVVSLVRSVLLFTAQHRPFRRVSHSYREALRVRVGGGELTRYAIARYIAVRLRWAGLEPMDETAGARMPGDLPFAELFPTGATLWQVGEPISELIESLVALGGQYDFAIAPDAAVGARLSL